MNRKPLAEKVDPRDRSGEYTTITIKPEDLVTLKARAREYDLSNVEFVKVLLGLWERIAPEDREEVIANK